MEQKLADNRHIEEYVKVFEHFFPESEVIWSQDEDGIIEQITVDGTVHMTTEFVQAENSGKIISHQYIVLLFGDENPQEYDFGDFKVFDPNKNKRRTLHFNWNGSSRLLQMAIPFVKENDYEAQEKLIDSLKKQNDLMRDFV